jgi:hypothetical protein
MACCRGTGDSCVCPMTPGLVRCDETPSLTPQRVLPAILPHASPSLSLSVTFEAPALPFETLSSLALPPLVPPPRF